MQSSKGGTIRPRRNSEERYNKGKRRVSFKPVSNSKFKKGNVEKFAKHFEEDDEMATSSTFQRRRSSPKPSKRNIILSKTLSVNVYGWYQITIYGQNFDKDILMGVLITNGNCNIVPLYWRNEKSSVIFFVNDFMVAEKIFQLNDKKIQMPNSGFRLSIKVRSGLPLITMDTEFKERMKMVMAQRYNANTKALDISKFHADIAFQNIFCGLFHSQIFKEVLEIISQNIPDLEALNLSDNNISRVDNLRTLKEKVPKLKILYLSNNRIQSLSALAISLKNSTILELSLKSNPVTERFKDASQYMREVKKKIPTLIKLDGQDLITNKTDVNIPLPNPKASFFCEVEGSGIVRQFLEQYFAILDSDDRKPLLAAYHDQALFSISIPPASQAGRLESFWKYNRNFLKLASDPEVFRAKMLKVGNCSIVSLLCEFPKMQHDLQSFSVDLCLYTPRILSFNVAGLFHEKAISSESNNNSGQSLTRYFHRQFIIVPNGSGFCIKNELLLVTNGSSLQLKDDFQLLEKMKLIMQ